jgi:hypothetical protein
VLEVSCRLNYERTITAAEVWLLEFNPVLTKWALDLRYGKQRAHEMSGTAEAEAQHAMGTGPDSASLSLTDTQNER